MIKVLANRCLEFDNGIEKVRTQIGFCELPGWVSTTPYFKAAIVDGSLKSFESNSPKIQEEILKGEEAIKALKDEYTALEEKIESTKLKGQEKVEALRADIAELEAKKEEILASNDSVKPSMMNGKR